MVTTVNLQDPFEYSLWVGILAGALILAAVVIFICIFFRLFSFTSKKKKAATVTVKAKAAFSIQALKNIYIKKVQDIDKRFAKGSLSKRKGYQELSAVIRGFVQEMTGINVENYTAAEIKEMGMSQLDLLMEEYYIPEFAEEEKAENRDLSRSCNTAAGVIRSWT